MERAYRRNTDVLREYLQIDGSAILDVGCGTGRLVKWLRKHGAFAIGLDPQAYLLEPPAIAGLGDALPFASGSFDWVIFFNSLHHIPVPAMGQALAEAGRVARSGVIVVEPIAQGSHFLAMQPIDDETAIRAEAYAALHSAEELKVTAETEWQIDYIEADLDEAIAGMIRVEPARAAKIAQMHGEVEARFYRFGRKVEQGWAFDQPMRLNRLTSCRQIS